MAKSIVLIGFMGAGKTTIGKLVAEKLNRKFIDTDEEIEKEYNLPVSQIFNELGEKAFRESEKNLIKKLTTQEDLILSLGGGAFLQEEIRNMCLASCKVIFLEISFQCWLNRLELIRDSRPVLQGKTVKEMQDLYISRKAIYSNYHLKINTDHKLPEEIAQQIIQEDTKQIIVRNVTFGKENPRICVPLTGRTRAELVNEASFLNRQDLDLVEWRVDFFEDVEAKESVIQVLTELREILIDHPIIFTFRSKREGGEREISSSYYFELNNTVIQSGIADIIDIELFQDENTVRDLSARAHSNGVHVIVSNHDFDKTPEKEVIIERLLRAKELGGDFPKIAVFPNHPRDVLTLLDATQTVNELYPDLMIITISMGATGIITRLAGNLFGSVLTFAAGNKGSAPGQISVREMREILKVMYQ